MFAFLSPRVLMLIGVIAALIAAFFFGVKFERGQNAEVELKKKAAYEAEVAQVREKSRAVEEQTARALEAEQKKNAGAIRPHRADNEGTGCEACQRHQGQLPPFPSCAPAASTGEGSAGRAACSRWFLE